jgi:hypothetical protein
MAIWLIILCDTLMVWTYYKSIWSEPGHPGAYSLGLLLSRHGGFDYQARFSSPSTR